MPHLPPSGRDAGASGGAVAAVAAVAAGPTLELSVKCGPNGPITTDRTGRSAAPRRSGRRPSRSPRAAARPSEYVVSSEDATQGLPAPRTRMSLTGGAAAGPAQESAGAVAAVTTVTGSANLRSTRCGRSWRSHREIVVGSVE